MTGSCPIVCPSPAAQGYKQKIPHLKWRETKCGDQVTKGFILQRKSRLFSSKLTVRGSNLEITSEPKILHVHVCVCNHQTIKAQNQVDGAYSLFFK